MSDQKKILVRCLVILFVQINFKVLSCTPVQISDSNDTNGEDFNGGDESSNSVTEHAAASSAVTRLVDLNNLDESNLEFLRKNNINLTALRVEQEKLREQKSRNELNGNLNMPAPLTQTRSPNRDEDHQRREYELVALDDIKTKIEAAVIRNRSNPSTMPSNVVKHEMAFNAECDMPRNFNESAWFSGDAWNIYFEIPNKKHSLESAILRIYKLPKNEEVKNCTENLEQLIRITVSVYERKRKRVAEIRKKQCSSLTVHCDHEGWVEMDVKMAVKQWGRSNRNLGLTVEVQDTNENYLRTLDYFHPIDCNQASKSKPIPWTSYDHFAKTSHGLDNLSKQPRIDVAWSDLSQIFYPFHSHSRLVRHNSNVHQHQSHNSNHHNHHRVLERNHADLLINSAESHEGHSEEMHATNNNQAHKKRHYKHKLEHSLRTKTSMEKLSRDGSSQETQV